MLDMMLAAKPSHIAGAGIVVVVRLGLAAADFAGLRGQKAKAFEGFDVQMRSVTPGMIPAPLLLTGEGLGHTRPLLLVAQVVQSTRPDATCRVAPSALHRSQAWVSATGSVVQPISAPGIRSRSSPMPEGQ